MHLHSFLQIHLTTPTAATPLGITAVDCISAVLPARMLVYATIVPMLFCDTPLRHRMRQQGQARKRWGRQGEASNPYSR